MCPCNHWLFLENPFLFLATATANRLGTWIASHRRTVRHSVKAAKKDSTKRTPNIAIFFPPTHPEGTAQLCRSRRDNLIYEPYCRKRQQKQPSTSQYAQHSIAPGTGTATHQSSSGAKIDSITTNTDGVTSTRSNGHDNNKLDTDTHMTDSTTDQTPPKWTRIKIGWNSNIPVDDSIHNPNITNNPVGDDKTSQHPFIAKLSSFISSASKTHNSSIAIKTSKSKCILQPKDLHHFWSVNDFKHHFAYTTKLHSGFPCPPRLLCGH